jgi:SNF2 family DNA or RNA helicase
VDYLRPLASHQLEGIKRATAPGTRDFAFLWDMGTRKTGTTINVLRHKYAEYRRLLRTLILCPKVMCVAWQREFHLDSKIGHQVFVLTGSQKQRIKLFNDKKELKPNPIFVMNYDGLQMKELLQELLAWQPEVLVCDESQRLKNPQAVRTKMAVLLADRALHRYILSGTPILNNPMDIWSQYRILDKGESFLDATGEPLNFYAFRGRYFIDKNASMPAHRHFPKWEHRDGILAELNKIIYQKAMRVMKDECLDLPDRVQVTIPVELAPEQKRLYDDMKEDFIAFLNSGEAITAQIAVTKALRLQQIVSGYCKTEDGTEISLKHNPRLEALEELLEDMSGKVIIWATFQENYRQIAGVLEKLGIPYTELHGQVPNKDRQKNIDRFQNDPECRAIVCNQAAAGLGVTLTSASNSIYYSRNFSLEQDQQSADRNYRSGSEIHKKITRYDITAAGTIDEVIRDALANKADLAEQILALKNRL